ncbi:MAG TPA: hypothetical protein PK819_02680 [Thermomicrobiales bacterium]|nr:hypothetical protein [Thermomicrobiales bacterium]
MRLRIVSYVAVVIMAMTGISVAFAQGANPNNPVAMPTASAEPTNDFFDQSNKKTPTPQDDGETAAPEASPVATDDGARPDLAAMVLDSSSLPDGWLLYGEQYIAPEQLVQGLAGLVSADEIEALGMTGYYESTYVNGPSVQVRTYIISYDSVQGVEAGFDLFENEELLVPNGDLKDLPALSGVGESPAEITTGTITEADGTIQTTYDISFRIGTMEVGAASETTDGSAPDRDLVQQMARDLADRVNAVLAGDDVAGVDPALPGQTVNMDASAAMEGYQTVAEFFYATDAADLPVGMTSSYVRAWSLSTRVTEVLPVVLVGTLTFETPNDVAAALTNAADLMPMTTGSDEIADFDGGSADDVVAYSYASTLGDGAAPDSLRAFVQVGSMLLVIDVQSDSSLADAQKMAETVLGQQLDCLSSGSCTVTTGSSTTL